MAAAEEEHRLLVGGCRALLKARRRQLQLLGETVVPLRDLVVEEIELICLDLDLLLAPGVQRLPDLARKPCPVEEG